MKPATYFTRNHIIYGISYKPEDKNSTYAIRFTDYDKAIEWLNTEEHDFRTRELCSKTTATINARYILTDLNKDFNF